MASTDRTPSAAKVNLPALREWMKQARGDGFLYCCETAEENGLTYEVLDALIAVADAARSYQDELFLEAATGGGDPYHYLEKLGEALDGVI